MLLQIIRYSVFAIFAGAGLVALGGWAVRTRQVNPFSRPGRFLRGATDPVLEPIENWLVKTGGNPQSAGWWLFGGALVGGIVVVSLAQWVLGQVAFVSGSANSIRGIARLLAFYGFRLLQLALIVRVMGSWVGAGRYSRWVRPAYVLTDWMLVPLGRIIPPVGMFDITPIIAWFGLNILMRLVTGVI
ncbi:MAG: YggT family protein [Gemmatimonadetes bacterium]|nr:YggT family protein [Gemmatimonadota bacterium]